MDFLVLADHRVKIKESKKIDEYLDISHELKKVRNMKVLVIPMVIGMLGMVPKDLERRQDEFEIKGQIENIQTIALLRMARILRRVQET